MRGLHVAACTASMLLGAAAMAESMTGTVDSVDLNSRTVVVDDVPYHLEGQVSGLEIDGIKMALR